MCWFVPLIIAGVSAVAQMKANEENTASEVNDANFNAAESARQAQLSEMQSLHSFDQGEADRDTYMRQAARNHGSMVTDRGASGMDVNSGSSVDILADNAALAYLDGKMIRHNAALESYGHKEDARNARVRAHLSLNHGVDAVKAGDRNKKMILLNAAGSMAGGLANKPMSTPGGGDSYYDPALQKKVSGSKPINFH